MVRRLGFKDRERKKRTTEELSQAAAEMVDVGDQGDWGERGGELVEQEAVGRSPSLLTIPAVDSRKQPGVASVLKKASLEVGKASQGTEDRVA